MAAKMKKKEKKVIQRLEELQAFQDLLVHL
jgi:hypothetical protein